jgi:ATP synthase protein I
MRPFRTVLLWQLLATAGCACLAAIPWGKDGAVSAARGGGINVAAGSVNAWIVSRREARTAAGALRTMFRAEAVKVLLIVLLLWLAMAKYPSIVHAAFLGSFVITVAIFAAAIAVRDRIDDMTLRATGHK